MQRSRRIAVESAVGGSACPQADDTEVPAIALGTTRSTTNALRTAHTTATRTDAFTLPKQRERVSAFTLAELVVTVGVLVLIVFLGAQLFKGAATVTTLGRTQMDADLQAQQLLDRMNMDFAQMVKRPDVDYYLKSSAASPLRSVPQPGNDQMAFYSTVPGYLPPSNYESPLSLVAYRVNSTNQMERMGKSLIWNGAPTPIPTPFVTPTPTATPAPVIYTPTVYIPVPLASPLPVGDLPSPAPIPLPAPPWPEVSSATASWSDSEVIGPQVFRFEYYYLLKDGSFSDIPWLSPHSSLAGPSGSGMGDVAAIVVDIAVIDPKSRVLLTNAQIASLAGQLVDWASGHPSGWLRTQWQATLNANTTLPRPVVSGIRVYERFIYLSPPVQ
jgi:hypothetical protein